MSDIRETAREFALRFGCALIMLVGVPTAIVGVMAMTLAPIITVFAVDHIGLIHVAEDDSVLLLGVLVAQLVWMAAGIALIDTYDESSDRLGVGP